MLKYFIEMDELLYSRLNRFDMIACDLQPFIFDTYLQSMATILLLL